MNEPTPRALRRIIQALRAWRRWQMPTVWWLGLALLALVLAGASWQGLRLERMRPPVTGGAAPPAPPRPPALASAGTGREESPNAAAAAQATPRSVPTIDASVGASALEPAAGSIAAAVGAAAPSPALDPSAGRLVLRCTTRGQVTYKDVNAACPGGAAERITVFPTEGVGRPR